MLRGFLAVQRFTTKVTGHFAFFVDEILKLNFWKGFFIFYIFSFSSLGSFVSIVIVEIISKGNVRLIFIIPSIIESFILFLVAIFGRFYFQKIRIF